MGPCDRSRVIIENEVYASTFSASLFLLKHFKIFCKIFSIY